MKSIFVFSFFLLSQYSFSQHSYKDSLEKFITDYVQKHEVIKGDDKQFLRFYAIDQHYRVNARFEKVNDAKWIAMQTSGTTKSMNRVYGILHFIIHDTTVTLNIYQSKDLLNVTQYKDYLFLPFTDRTSGEETYANGRYIDLTEKDIVNNSVILDFNKAYNPYCAYITGLYNCPIPPHENDLPVSIKAGEKIFEKKH